LLHPEKKALFRPLSSVGSDLSFDWMAKVRILLIPEHRESLLTCLPAGSRVWALLQRAAEARSSGALFDVNYEIVCSQRDAYILLDNARKTCPGAVERIEAGIKASQQKGS
jgi:hypothetical protein